MAIPTGQAGFRSWSKGGRETALAKKNETEFVWDIEKLPRTQNKI